jgi:hypothetical protein
LAASASSLTLIVLARASQDASLVGLATRVRNLTCPEVISSLSNANATRGSASKAFSVRIISWAVRGEIPNLSAT